MNKDDLAAGGVSAEPKLQATRRVAGLDWLDEIDLDPEGNWLRMGTRALGDRPWLVADGAREEELALKAELLATRHHEVFAAQEGTEAASAVALDLILDETGYRPPSDEKLHPLDAAGRIVQEDLCLLRREAGGWLLVAASLCFPSRWRLAEKMGKPLAAVHGPVDGYAEVLDRRVDSLIDRLDERLVWRRNWFIHPDASLFQPDRPVDPEPIIDAERCLTDLHLRSERQTLRRLDGSHVLFTIRIQQCPVADLVAVAERRTALIEFCRTAPAPIVAHRGLNDLQITELLASLRA